MVILRYLLLKRGVVPPLAEEDVLVVVGQLDADIVEMQFIAGLDDAAIVNKEGMREPLHGIAQGESGKELVAQVWILYQMLSADEVAAAMAFVQTARLLERLLGHRTEALPLLYDAGQEGILRYVDGLIVLVSRQDSVRDKAIQEGMELGENRVVVHV